MIVLGFHSFFLLLLAVVLLAGCASPRAAVSDRDAAVEGKLGADHDGARDRIAESHHDHALWLYELARNYIVNDANAARTCEMPNPVPVRVWDRVSCGFFPLSAIPGLLQFFYPTDRADSEYYYDSLDHWNAPPCEGYRDAAMTTRLSTSLETKRTLMFCEIDSASVPGHYIVLAFLFNRFWAYCDSDTEDDTEWMGELYQDEPFPMQCGWQAVYLLVYDRAGNLVWELDDDDQCEIG